MSASCRHLKPSKAHKIRLNEGDQISLNLSKVSFLQFLILNLHEHGTSIYSVRVLKFRWENSNETHLKLPQKTSYIRGVTWFLYLGPPKTISTPTLYVTWKV